MGMKLFCTVSKIWMCVENSDMKSPLRLALAVALEQNQVKCASLVMCIEFYSVVHIYGEKLNIIIVFLIFLCTYITCPLMGDLQSILLI
jgi:hypothetical protein